MATSVIEQILAQVKAVLTGTTSADENVFRAREDGFGEDELPALNIRRAGGPHESLGDAAQKVFAAWTVEHLVKVDEDWETAADQLHMEVHAALAGDATLATLGRNLRCTETACEADAADQVAGKLTARYQMQCFVRPGDLTRRAS